MKQERIHWIDICKGFLIILVVIGHVISSYNGSGYSNSIYKTTFSVIYSFHMASFIFISGYLWKIKSRVSNINQIKKKLITYGIPYIIFSIIWVVFKLVFSKYVNTTIGIKDLVGILIFPISFMWYLYAVMLMNIVQVLIEKNKKEIIIFISFVLLLLKPVLINYLPIFKDLIICDYISFWFYFLLGHYYGQVIVDKISSNKIFAIMCMVLFIVANCLLLYSNDTIVDYIKIITAISGIIIVTAVFKRIGECKCLEYLGSKSLSIYVLQGIVIAAIRILIGHIAFLNDEYKIIPLIVCTIFGVLISLTIEIISSKIWKLDFIFYPNKYIKTE